MAGRNVSQPRLFPLSGHGGLSLQLLKIPSMVLFVCALAQLASAEEPAQPKVLRCNYATCLERAMRRSPLLAAAGMSLDLYEAKAREAHAIAYPRLTATGFASALPRLKPGTNGDNVFADYDFADWGPLLLGELSVSQPVYTFGKIATLRRLAAQGVQIGHATRKIAADELRFQLAKAYWGLVMVNGMKDMIADGTKLVDEQRTKLEKQRDEGDEKFNQADLFRLQIFQADIDDKVRLTERTRQAALDGLRMAMNDPMDVLVQPTDEEIVPLEVSLLPMEAYETLALANQPRLIAMRDGVAARLEQVELAKSQLYPDVALVARIAGVYAPTRNSSTDSIAANPNNTANSGAGLALSWNIDIFRNLAKLEQARVEYNQSATQEKGEREKTRIEVRQLYRELADARAMLKVHEQAMKSARGWLNAASQMYEDGFEEFPEVLRAIEAYTRRRFAHMEAIFNHNLAVAALSRGVGMDVTQVPRVLVGAGVAQ